jgi:catechol 2,3-dioxygenase-like lactoylglutathione lyase family enzyme
MFTNTQATAMLPAKDVSRAKSWYADKLGLKPVEEFGDNGAAYDLGGTRVFLYSTQFAGTAQHTVLTFNTDDLASDMKTLRSRGVSFLDYDLPDLKTKDGIAEFGEIKNAWSKDSEGNILGFVEGEM